MNNNIVWRPSCSDAIVYACAHPIVANLKYNIFVRFLALRPRQYLAFVCIVIVIVTISYTLSTQFSRNFPSLSIFKKLLYIAYYNRSFGKSWIELWKSAQFSANEALFVVLNTSSRGCAFWCFKCALQCSFVLHAAQFYLFTTLRDV